MWSLGLTLLELFTEKDAWMLDEGEELEDDRTEMEIILERMQGKILPASLNVLGSKFEPWNRYLASIVIFSPNDRPTALQILQG